MIEVKFTIVENENLKETDITVEQKGENITNNEVLYKNHILKILYGMKDINESVQEG